MLPYTAAGNRASWQRSGHAPCEQQTATTSRCHRVPEIAPATVMRRQGRIQVYPSVISSPSTAEHRTESEQCIYTRVCLHPSIHRCPPSLHYPRHHIPQTCHSSCAPPSLLVLLCTFISQTLSHPTATIFVRAIRRTSQVLLLLHYCFSSLVLFHRTRRQQRYHYSVHSHYRCITLSTSHSITSTLSSLNHLYYCAIDVRNEVIEQWPWRLNLFSPPALI